MNGVVAIDKPEGPTSHDVVAKVRRILHTRAVGHAGTLDPMATGVLVLAVGEATRLVPWLMAYEKEYRATLKLGTTTLSLDRMSDVVEEKSVPNLSRAHIEQIANTFLGVRPQRVPNVSAVRVDGVRLHVTTRKGIEVEAPMRTVELHRIHVEDWNESTHEITFSIVCGSGYYVRALARDWAEALATVGHLTMLRRTRIGTFRAESAETLETLSPQSLATLRDSLAELPIMEVDEEETKRLRFGQRLGRHGVAEGDYRITHGDELVAIAKVEAGRLSGTRVFPPGTR